MTKPTRRRAGFTLIELMITVVLVGILGTMLTTVLTRQQRFHRAVSNLTDARARMRDIQTILPTDLRSISTSARDLMAISDTSIQVRAFVGASVLCDYPAATIVGLPPKTLASGNVLSAWINPPAPNDILYVYNDSTEAGNADDTWTPFAITDTASETNSAWCPSTANPPFTTAADNTARRYRLTLASAPTVGKHRLGAPLRIAREVRYSIYQASDNEWYVGYQRCTPHATYGTPGSCGTREVLAGPVRAATTDTTTSGLYFVFYNKSGTRLTTLAASDTVASISVGIRTSSESMMQATSRTGGSMASGDSLRFVIGMRNRI